MNKLNRTGQRILFAIGSLGQGGTESQLCLLVRELTQRGWLCELFALEAQGALRKDFEDIGIPIHDGGITSDAGLPCKCFSLARSFLRFLRITAATKPDVLHAFLPLINFMGALTGRVTGTPKVITSRRALGVHQDRHPYWKPVDRLSNALSHRVVVNSQAVGYDTIARDHINAKKLVLIHNGVQAARFVRPRRTREDMRTALGLGVQDLGMVMVANLIPYKGHADLLHALPKAVDGKTDVRVFFVGEDRGIQGKLHKIAVEHQIAEQVHFLGLRNDIPDILSAMDLFVMASHEEGFSNALLEAMAAGLPIVATDVGGNREALDDGSMGILVPPKAPEALAEALSLMIANRNMRDRMAARAREHVTERYSIDRMVQSFIQLYKE